MYIAIHNNHSPRFDASRFELQRDVAGMSNFLDLNTVLKSTGMWKNTLLIISADNGGTSGTDGSAANNCPYRGGKYSNFEGIPAMRAPSEPGFPAWTR